MTHLVPNLKAYLQAKNMTPARLAHEAGIQQPTLHRILDEKIKDPRVSTLWPLANFIGVSVEDLRSKDLTTTIHSYRPIQGGLPSLARSAVIAPGPSHLTSTPTGGGITDLPLGWTRISDMVKVPHPNSDPDEIQKYLNEARIRGQRRNDLISAFTVAKNRLAEGLVSLIPNGSAEGFSKIGPSHIRVFFRSPNLALEVSSLYPPHGLDTDELPPKRLEMEYEYNMLALSQKVHAHLFRLALIKRNDNVAAVLLVLCSGIEVPKQDDPTRQQLEWQASEFGVVVFFADVADDPVSVLAGLATGKAVVPDDFEDVRDE